MIGLDISDRSIKVVEVTEAPAPAVRTVCWSPLAPEAMRRGIILDPAYVANALREALEKCSPVRVAGARVIASIPETQSFVRVIDLPVMSERDLGEAVTWAVRQHIPFDLERVYLDWQVVPGVQKQEGEQQQVLVGASQRDVVDPLLEVIDAVGLQVAALELEAQALVRSLLPQDAAGIRGVLLVDIGATSTNVVFFDNGTMRFTTSIQRGGDDFTRALAERLNIQPAVAAEKKALVGVMEAGSDQVAAALRELVAQLAQEINQVIRDALVQLRVEEGVRTVLLSGGSANLPGIRDVFAEVFAGVPVQLGNPLVNLIHDETGSSPLAMADALHFTTAIGLALRQV